MNELDALLILNAVKDLSNYRIKQLIQHYGSADQVLTLSEEKLIFDQMIPGSVVKSIFSLRQDEFLKKEHDLMKRNQVRVLTHTDFEFPAILKEIPDAPVVLYAKGQIETKLTIAIVGSRQASL